MFAHEPQIVTNLVVNQKVNLPRASRAAIKKEVIGGVARLRTFPPPLSGKVYWLRSINAQCGNRLLNRVKQEIAGQTRTKNTNNSNSASSRH